MSERFANDSNVTRFILNMHHTNNFQVLLVPLELIHKAPYQKSLDLKRCQRIAEHFDPHRMSPIQLSYRDGKYWVYDGQHRVKVYELLGESKIPAVVHSHLTYEQEAYLFARQQEEVGAVNCNHKWNALVEAKDEEVMEILRICKDYGFTVLEKNNRGNNIKCVKHLRDFYREFGPTKLMAVLMTLGVAWEYKPHSVDYPIFEGVTRLVRTYPELDYNRLAKVLSDTTPKVVLRDMEDEFHALRGEGRRAAAQILKLYNKNLRGKNKLDVKLLK